jgi:hypothetical protein
MMLYCILPFAKAEVSNESRFRGSDETLKIE